MCLTPCWKKRINRSTLRPLFSILSNGAALWASASSEKLKASYFYFHHFASDPPASAPCQFCTLAPHKKLRGSASTQTSEIEATGTWRWQRSQMICLQKFPKPGAHGLAWIGHTGPQFRTLVRVPENDLDQPHQLKSTLATWWRAARKLVFGSSICNKMKSAVNSNPSSAKKCK